MRSLPDVCVVGAGPAGLSCAIAAASRGLHVRILDAAPCGPIDKACGEGLLPDALRCLDQLGVRIEVAHPLEGIRFHAAGKTAKASFRDASGLGVRRTELHRALLHRAAQHGIQVEWATPLRQLYTARARFVVGADGAQSRLRALIGLTGRISTRRIGLRQHFAVRPWSEFVEVFWASNGTQAYVTPVADDQVNVAILSHQKFETLSHALQRFPELRDRLAGAPVVGAARGALTVTHHLPRVTAQGKFALVGDASGSVDAITGEGINLCLRQAEALADAMAADHLEHYERVHPSTLRMARVMSAALLTMGRSRTIQSAAMAMLIGVPGIFQHLLQTHVGQGIPLATSRRRAGTVQPYRQTV